MQVTTKSIIDSDQSKKTSDPLIILEDLSFRKLKIILLRLRRWHLSNKLMKNSRLDTPGLVNIQNLPRKFQRNLRHRRIMSLKTNKTCSQDISITTIWTIKSALIL